jgi:hypothetical protein
MGVYLREAALVRGSARAGHPGVTRDSSHMTERAHAPAPGQFCDTTACSIRAGQSTTDWWWQLGSRFRYDTNP